VLLAVDIMADLEGRRAGAPGRKRRCFATATTLAPPHQPLDLSGDEARTVCRRYPGGLGIMATSTISADHGLVLGRAGPLLFRLGQRPAPRKLERGSRRVLAAIVRPPTSVLLAMQRRALRVETNELAVLCGRVAFPLF